VERYFPICSTKSK
jgi:hypothetical protein